MFHIRDKEQTALAELHENAAGTLVRYRELIDTDIDERLRDTLQQIVGQRKALVERLAQCVRQRDDHPKAADPETQELHVVVDRLMQMVNGTEGSAARLLENERAWRERLQSNRDLNWHVDEQTLIDALLLHTDEAIDRLDVFTGQA
ncbi:hypothetical protein [Thiosocius teredinicola]|uniref:hypothetical protein n=1 Tax=Thiosocius teredinicola TaxID=1973002 RepID=UPI000F7A2278